MTFNTYGKKENPSLLLIPGLGVSFEIFLPLIELMKDKYYIVTVGIDGFLIGKESHFTSVNDQAGQIISYVQGDLTGIWMLPMDSPWVERYCPESWNGTKFWLTTP